MKNLCILAIVFLGGRMLPACSDDGVYTPIEHPDDAGPEPVQACQFVDVSLCDAGQIDAEKP